MKTCKLCGAPEDIYLHSSSSGLFGHPFVAQEAASKELDPSAQLPVQIQLNNLKRKMEAAEVKVRDEHEQLSIAKARIEFLEEKFKVLESVASLNAADLKAERRRLEELEDWRKFKTTRPKL